MKMNDMSLWTPARFGAVLWLGALITSLTSCDKKVEPKEEFQMTVDNIQLEVTKLNTPTPLHNAANIYWMAQAGNAIYLASPSNSGSTQFFDKYDLSTNTFTSLNTSPWLCACGYSSKIVSDGTNLFYIPEGRGGKYNTATNTWSTTAYSAEAGNTGGEPGVGVLNGRIYFIGQRDKSKAFKYYDIASNAWGFTTDYLYSTNSSLVVGAANKLYVFGGDDAVRKVSVYDPATQTWTAKRDATFDIGGSWGSHLTALLQDRFVFLLKGNKIYIYDIQTDNWSVTPRTITVNAGLGSQNIFAINGKLYLAGINDANFELFELKVK
ncbi:MAG TPA: hypothetical protein VD794_02025 [Flavisolibacter sp.]|nr:hypothetical protein [Flavisolibacter sp.]